MFIPSIFYNSEGKECRHFDLSFLGEGRRVYISEGGG